MEHRIRITPEAEVDGLEAVSELITRCAMAALEAEQAPEGCFVRSCCGNAPRGARTAPQRGFHAGLLPKQTLWRQFGATGPLTSALLR